MTAAALLLAAAVVLGGRLGRIRLHALIKPPQPRRLRPRCSVPTDPLAAASAFDVLAACLVSGMAVSAAAAATAEFAPPGLSALLHRASDMLALGSDATSAWSGAGVPHDAHAEALMRLARRSAESGSALAAGVAALADESRQDAADAAQASAERASVLIAGPLGACYLPAFLCLGIVPVVAGLAGEVLQTGLW
ncbi:type II secretion system F family protein [Mycolicibacterium sp. S2-37]|uniref:type II secretion system F family protein n=1 Tax=Mycolicibacterium sp. S2-37 TaxID=2810297 RepID=UPI001A94F2D6|nr:type II secretion system F family protein [Mycolicibacterium sp. S2-37]MBO0680976.1 type II secretion system F family protein [Mycolicibacterium sp. S2-37]